MLGAIIIIVVSLPLPTWLICFASLINCCVQWYNNKKQKLQDHLSTTCQFNSGDRRQHMDFFILLLIQESCLQHLLCVWYWAQSRWRSDGLVPACNRLTLALISVSYVKQTSQIQNEPVQEPDLSLSRGHRVESVTKGKHSTAETTLIGEFRLERQLGVKWAREGLQEVRF